MPWSARTIWRASWPCAKAWEADRRSPAAPYLYHDLTPRVLSTPRHFAYIKIAEGCDHPCTFCVIPQYRGAFRSRRFESVVAEATRLFAAGRARNQPDRPGHHLLSARTWACQTAWRCCWNGWRQIETPREKWIRFLYAYPNKVTQRLLDTMAAHPFAGASTSTCRCSTRARAVLKRMKRGASGDIFLKLLERIRRTIPGVAIRTSFIVGFPGETAADFEELCQFVEAARFDNLGVFLYSDEDTSASYRAGRQSRRAARRAIASGA